MNTLTVLLIVLVVDASQKFLPHQPIPRTHYLNPSLVMHSSLHLFREIRHPEVFSVHHVAFETLDGSHPLKISNRLTPDTKKGWDRSST